MPHSKHFKTVLFISAILFFYSAKAENYYLSNTGNDSNSGTSASYPWKTLEKLNSFKYFKPGDNILFKRGDTFYGSIRLANTYGTPVNYGTAGNPITFSSYGVGDKPIITGFTHINNWTNLGGNIWESAVTVSELSTCNLVAINGVNTPMGRYPNTGWKPIKSSTHNSITDNNLPVGNWTGGQVVTRVERPVIDKYLITSQTEKTVHFTNPNEYSPRSGWGYFIQSHANTLDTLNEWYFNPTNKKLKIYSKTQPQNVKVTSIDTLVSVLVTDYITFDDIHFSGANKYLFVIGSSKNITIQNCQLDFSGEDAIWGKNFWRDINSDNLKIVSNTIRDNNNYSIYLENEKKNAYIGYNTINRTAMIAGASASGDAKGIAIMSTGKLTLIEHNSIKQTGYTAIYFQGNGTVIKNNFIDSFCLVKDDGGGIYTWTPTVAEAFHGMKILDNIVLNGIGNIEGVKDGSSQVWTEGIYLDNRSSFVEVSGNTIAKCNRAGIFLYRGQGNNIHHNLCYDNKYGVRFQDDLGTVINDTIRQNIFISKTEDQFPGSFQAPHNNISSFGIFDSNYYVKPFDSSLVIETAIGKGSHYSRQVLTLEAWKNQYHFDMHSKNSPVSLKPFTYVRKAEGQIKNGQFDSDIHGVSWWSEKKNLVCSWINKKIDNGTLQISYTKPSFVNTRPGFNLPVGAVDAGRKYILKFTTLAQTGSKSIYAVMRKENGEEITSRIPALVSINRNDNEILMIPEKSTPSALITFTWDDSDLNDTFWMDNIQLFEATVKQTDPDDYFLFKYNASSSNKIFQLPGNYIDVTGKSYSGNVTLAPFSSIVLIKNTDKKKDNFPIADSGPDQTIFLPLNNINLSGTGTSETAKITGYKWTKVSGPSGELIKSPGSAKTSVTGLKEGTYLFELKVTDNNGLVGKDTMRVIVIAKTNTAPVANAGGDKTITLPVNTITLRGSGSDVDGKIVSWLWTKISGPASFNIVNSASPVTDASGLVAGVYRFELKVTDNNGGVGKDTMQVTVIAKTNISPVANAGSDKTITLPLNSVTLSGSGNDVDGKIVSLLWTKIAGPASFNIVNPASLLTDVRGLVAGVYLFELKVTDDRGGIGKDTVQVTVIAKANIPPVADAGPDITIILPGNTVILNGNGADADGTIVSYLWRQISGPNDCSIESAKSARTNITDLVGGTYRFELTVSDNMGAIGRDTMTLTAALSRLSPESTMLRFYPNPVNDIGILEINSKFTRQNMLIVISDSEGKVMMRKHLNVSERTIHEMIYMANFARGVYFLTVYFTEINKQSLKILKL